MYIFSTPKNTGKLAALALSLLIPSLPLTASAQETIQGTIVVSGTGEVSAVPDQAQVSAGVVTQAETADEALDANTEAMDRVFATLREADIEDRNIRTSNFSVSPQYEPYRQSNPNPRRIIGYQVSNQVTVVLEDIGDVATTIDALIRSGANQLYGVVFSISDPKPLAEEARRAAVEDAAAKAQTLAEASGMNLGAPILIQEGGFVMPVVRQFFAVGGAPPPPAAPPRPVAAGEQNVTVNVSVTYRIQ